MATTMADDEKMIQFRTTEQDHAALKVLAAKRRTSVRGLMQGCIDALLAEDARQEALAELDRRMVEASR